ncbi:hypothetical protein [Nocardioides sp. YIM 152315]|uniref:hypothetical protein n=1 Tax=Nocardioides sp. YIM 152315 TaxID=3031760 RepID=UPI0023DBF097|nr:hypothetical protein [Nocardioides sp. YIM 152315]MDF1603364.1 hypothetical protein [Nocardioides sp. YIM 152315]
MSDFSDREFHVGSLVGLRAFSVDSLGRLNGPSQGGIFKPGVNEAECKTDPYTKALAAQLAQVEARLYGLEQVEAKRGKKAKRGELSTAAVGLREATKPKHTLAGLGCKCGFYAYFDGMNDYLRTGRVAAVVEGFGVYTLGTRGFRTSKARLLALIQPEMGSSESYLSVLAFTPTFGRTPPSTVDSMTPLLWSYVQRNYPDVPVFASQDEALAEYPLFQPEAPTPDTDPDFWTRSAS